MCHSESLSELSWTQGSLPGCIISSATHSIFCVVRTVHFRPLLSFREIEFIFSILRRRSLTELTAQFLLENSLQMRLAPHPFCWRTSLVDVLSSYVKWRYTVFLIVFPVELGCFHLFYPITKLLKIFVRKLHMLLKIYYISECVIYFKCTLLLEDIISWHVGDSFLWPTLYFVQLHDARVLLLRRTTAIPSPSCIAVGPMIQFIALLPVVHSWQWKQLHLLFQPVRKCLRL